MKGQYINTAIKIAALAGKKSRRQATQKETITSMNDFKIIWSKNQKPTKATAEKAVSELID